MFSFFRSWYAFSFSTIFFAFALMFAFGGVVFAQSNSPAQPCSGYDEQDPYGIKCGEASTLTSRDPRTIIAEMINVFLGLTGIILIGYVLYAGYLWMTAAGEEEQIGKAKSIIASCVMGLIIVLSAYSISNFVIKQVISATGI